ncbi:MAG TPA: MBL fold metallo-hydrolase [Pyrinomonadaceae bacterium]|nr:MBL fold metallo-hydrolase [Pyrinomonadaceae bacterium]
MNESMLIIRMNRLLLFIITIGAWSVSTGCALASFGTAEPAPFIPSEARREPLSPADQLEVRYIANEGVLITAGGKRVLIDGLHRRYGPEYAYLPVPEREKIESARPPFDAIDLVLVSHRHGDHFHPESVGLYLKNSPKTLFASSQQVVDEAAAGFAGYEAIKGRVTPIPFTLQDRRSMNLAGIDVEFLGLGHGSGRHSTIQNLGHVISLGGKKLLHVGDAEFTADIFDAFDLEQKGIDIAFLPAWFLTNKMGRDLVEQHIKPKHIIAVHVGPNEADEVRKQIKPYFPDADVFGTMLEKRQY